MNSIFQSFRGPQLEHRYASEFATELMFDNLERSKFISFLGGLFFILLIGLDLYRLNTGLFHSNSEYKLAFIGHLLLSMTLFPAYLYYVNRKSIRNRSFKYPNLIIQLTIWSVCISLLWLSLLGFFMRNSLTNFAIYILIINLVFTLPRPILYWLNLGSLITMTIGILYFQSDGTQMVLVNLLELAGLTFPTFVIAIYQFNSKKRQFINEQKIREQQVIIEESIVTAFNKRIAETEMNALRAQMNPHFLFNCLNSIKLYMVQNDPQTAATYLTKFAKLIRLILNNSQSKMVVLGKELEALELYIEMEQFRFKDKFDYEVIIDPSLNLVKTEIPPLILQPYVENAIWHGLMHKENGKGKITMTVLAELDAIKFVIEDNGIGREKASEVKSRSAVKDKSYGMKITKDRIAITNEIFQTKASVDIIDLKDQDGNATGTRVIIYLPR